MVQFYGLAALAIMMALEAKWHDQSESAGIHIQCSKNCRNQSVWSTSKDRHAADFIVKYIVPTKSQRFFFCYNCRICKQISIKFCT